VGHDRLVAHAAFAAAVTAHATIAPAPSSQRHARHRSWLCARVQALRDNEMSQANHGSGHRRRHHDHHAHLDMRVTRSRPIAKNTCADFHFGTVSHARAGDPDCSARP
jgi:hypothetical protein